MPTILFNDIVYGPVHSRRLGVSLGVNLLPPDGKLCSFDCIYCECGLNAAHHPQKLLPPREAVREALEHKLAEMAEKGAAPDVISFAGNGEPTMHPAFAGIIDDTIALRDRYFPQAKVSVFTNATMLGHEDVFRALCKADNNILKLDSALDSRIRRINAPNAPSFSFASLKEQLLRFKGDLIIQTMFLKGIAKGVEADNTSEPEIEAWLEALKEIKPRLVMIYTIDRDTAIPGLMKAPGALLDEIAGRARAEGFNVQVSK